MARTVLAIFGILRQSYMRHQYLTGDNSPKMTATLSAISKQMYTRVAVCRRQSHDIPDCTRTRTDWIAKKRKEVNEARFLDKSKVSRCCIQRKVAGNSSASDLCVCLQGKDNREGTVYWCLVVAATFTRVHLPTVVRAQCVSQSVSTSQPGSIFRAV